MLCGYDVSAGPDLIEETDPAALPEEWNAIPNGQASAGFCCNWLRAVEQLGLVLTSVLVPHSRNLLLNPLHPSKLEVAPVHQEPFQLDQRLA